MKDETLMAAFDEWEYLSQTPETIIAYQSRLKAIIDEEARLADMHDRGIEKGIEQGIRQTIMKFIAKGFSDEVIAGALERPVEEIQAIRKECK